MEVKHNEFMTADVAIACDLSKVCVNMMSNYCSEFEYGRNTRMVVLLCICPSCTSDEKELPTLSRRCQSHSVFSPSVHDDHTSHLPQ